MAKETVYKTASSPSNAAAMTGSQQQRVNTPKATATLGNNTLQQIKQKAEAGIKLDTVTPEKQAAYNAFQERSKQLIVQRARDGGRLHEPNAWKESIYQEARQHLNPNDKAYYNSDNIMDRQTNQSDAYKNAQGEFLSGSRDAYMQTQEAMLGKARDQQIADLQKALEDAVTEGTISVREAEAAFTEQKATIEQEGYNDAERTKVAMGARGIQNSAQSLGMEASDNSRRTSMINKNMTERDQRVATIKDRVNAIKNKSAIDIGSANANYNYGLAGAQGQADMQYNQQMYDMNSQENNMNRQQQFQLDMQGMTNKQAEKMAQIGQSYTLEQFAVQQGYNLTNMSVQQKYQLEQMYKGHVYNLAIQDDQQNWQGGQNKLDRNHQSFMQNDQQLWQGNQNGLDRNHQTNMQNDQQKWQGTENLLDRTHQTDMRTGQQSWQSGENKLDREATAANIATQITASVEAAEAARTAAGSEYETALAREMAKYDPNSAEGKLAEKQQVAARKAMEEEFKMNSQLRIATEQVAKGGIPTDPGKKPTKPGKNWFQSLQSKVAKAAPIFSGFGLNEKNLEEKRLKQYNEEVKLWESAKAAYDNYNKVFGNK